MAYLNSEYDLIEYIKRKLGGEIYTIEITDNQWNDILAEAKEEFYEYSSFGTQKDWIVIEPNGQTEIVLNNVRAILQCYGGSTIISSNYLIPSDIYRFMVLGSTDSITSYIISNQYLSTIRQQFSEQIVYDYNPDSRILKLARSDYDKIALEVLVEVDPNKLVNNRFFQKLVEAKALRQWSRNIGLKYNVENASMIGNGLNLNPQRMLEEAEKLEEEVKTGLEEDEFGTVLAPRRLYG